VLPDPKHKNSLDEGRKKGRKQNILKKNIHIVLMYRSWKHYKEVNYILVSAVVWKLETVYNRN
jgi:hypothetical protein